MMDAIKHIESPSNPLIRHMVRLSKEKKYRIAQDEILCEGEKMLEEALESGIVIENILMDEKQPCSKLLLKKALENGAKACTVPQKLLAVVSNVETPQGIVFTCKRSDRQIADLRGTNRLIVLDGLQDPGNMGTILRTADAFDIDGVILCEGCTDYTSPKVVRATMGAIFRIPIITAKRADTFSYLKAHNIPIYAAALSENSVSITAANLKRAAVIIGNEGSGVSEEVLRLCDKPIIIPMKGRAESLNASVAASIIMWEMTRN